MIRNAFFDLDGTLVDTVEGIAKALNEALAVSGVSISYSRSEVISMIGRGADTLLRKALKEKGNDDSLFAIAKRNYLPLYEKYQIAGSRPFSGMKGTLEELLRRGVRLFVYTNKPQKLARELLEYHFPPLFDEIDGQIETRAVKPNPAPIFEMMERHGLKKEESIYIGDSIVDSETAKAAGLPLILCTYGYGKYDEPLLSKARYLVAEPEDIAKIPVWPS